MAGLAAVGLGLGLLVGKKRPDPHTHRLHSEGRWAAHEEQLHHRHHQHENDEGRSPPPDGDSLGSASRGSGGVTASPPPPAMDPGLLAQLATQM